MDELDDVIDRREIGIRCWNCDWQEPRMINWVAAQRHMSCPSCDRVIVLDSSTVRREINLQRKQLSALHGQMVNMMQSASKISRRVQPPPRLAGMAPKMDLALARSHPNTLMPSMRPAAAARRLQR